MTPTTLSKKEMFDQVISSKMKADQADKDRKASKGGHFQKYDPITWLGLEKGHYLAFRILGLPPEFRGPTDVKEVFASFIVDDARKAERRVIWKPEADADSNLLYDEKRKANLDQTWILHRLHSDIMAFDWKHKTEEDWKNQVPGVKIFHHEDSEAFKRVKMNQKKDSRSPIVKRFAPRHRIVMNVIDRQDSSWHIENKHSKLLSAKIATYAIPGTDRVREYIDVGLPKTCYDMIIENVIKTGVARNNDWEELDIVIRRLDHDPWYEVRDATESKIGEALSIAHDKPLTADEQAYERYDIDKLFQTTTYQKLFTNLKGLFQSWDGYKGTNYYEELRNLAEDERIEFHKKYGSETASASTAPISTAGSEEDSTKVDPSIPPPVVKQEFSPPMESNRRRTPPTTDMDSMSYVESNFKHYKVLSESEVSYFRTNMKTVSNGVPIWDSSIRVILCDNNECRYPDTEIRTAWPDSITKCPCCGMDYEVEGDSSP